MAPLFFKLDGQGDQPAVGLDSARGFQVARHFGLSSSETIFLNDEAGLVDRFGRIPCTGDVLQEYFANQGKRDGKLKETAILVKGTKGATTPGSGLAQDVIQVLQDILAAQDKLTRTMTQLTGMIIGDLESLLASPPPDVSHLRLDHDPAYRGSLIMALDNQLNDQGKMFCVVLGRRFPEQVVMAGRYYPRAAAKYAPAALHKPPEVVDDVENGYLWASPVHYGYQQQWLIFSTIKKSASEHWYQVHVIDKNKLEEKIADCGLPEHQEALSRVLGNMKWKELDGRVITFNGKALPCHQAIMLHARYAIQHKPKNEFPGGFNSTDFDFSSRSAEDHNELVQDWLDKMPPINVATEVLPHLREKKQHRQRRLIAKAETKKVAGYEQSNRDDTRDDRNRVDGTDRLAYSRAG